MSIAAGTNTIEISEKAIEARRNYFREYRAKNREKLRQYNRAYGKKWRAAHPEKVREYAAAQWERIADRDIDKLSAAIAEELNEQSNDNYKEI